MDVLNKARLFGNYNFAFGKTQKILDKASLYLPKDFTSLIKVLDATSSIIEKAEKIPENYVINKFYNALSHKLPRTDFEEWKLCIKAAVISKEVCKWKQEENYKECFLSALVRGLPIMILKLEDPASFRDFELKMIEGKSIEEAALTCFGVSIEHYIGTFMKHFNYKKLAEAQEMIVDCASFMARCLSDKEQKSSTLWICSQNELAKIGLEMSEDAWADKMSLLFVKTAALDDKFK